MTINDLKSKLEALRADFITGTNKLKEEYFDDPTGLSLLKIANEKEIGFAIDYGKLKSPD